MNSMQHSRLNKGQGLVEYALLLGSVAIVVTGSVALMGLSIGNIFSNVVAQLGNFRTLCRIGIVKHFLA